MMHKQEFLQKYPQLHTGTDLYSDDGEKLGEIIDMEDDCVVVSKGSFFAREFTCRYDDIAKVESDRAVIDRRQEDLAPWREESYQGWDEFDRMNRGAEMSGEQGEARIQLSEEELQAQKTENLSEAHVRKVVHTEMQNLTVPVTREELVVERTPVMEGQQRQAGENAFREEDLTVQLREEQVEVTKRPVVTEEVTVSKRAVTEQERVSEEVRKEELEVDEGRTSTSSKTNAPKSPRKH